MDLIIALNSPLEQTMLEMMLEQFVWVLWFMITLIVMLFATVMFLSNITLLCQWVSEMWNGVYDDVHDDFEEYGTSPCDPGCTHDQV